ncbi:MAG: beta-galactosidase [Ruminococcaceae bacterium]|nr:beta-galactosidase [Oscillospiraceae bacterium]
MTMSEIMRNEYPRPGMVRESWLNLNGEWDFTIDNTRSGLEREFYRRSSFDMKINVPFCPQSKLSGIEHTDFMYGVWYTRAFTTPEGWQEKGRRTFLHIGACDYYTIVYINGEKIGFHRGGMLSFSFDITKYLNKGENRVTVFAADDERSDDTPSGKQSMDFYPSGTMYTRTTGIWQTVWLENTPDAYIKHIKMTPNAKESELLCEIKTANAEDMTLTAVASFKGKEMGYIEKTVAWDHITFSLPLKERYLWDVDSPNLYDIEFTLGDDKVKSYFGLRDIALKNGVTYLNGRPIFQRLVLDQGFYREGIYTAPCDNDLYMDIVRAKECGFNGARLHMKVFEERFLYHCDRLGYLVWGEYPNWGLGTGNGAISYQNMASEWFNEILRDYNHPAIIGWCPMNETGHNVDVELIRHLYEITKAYDPTRLFIGVSGFHHVEGCYDMLDCHDYNQDPVSFKERYAPLNEGKECEYIHETLYKKPVWEKSDKLCFLSEYGGASWHIDSDKKGDNDWGYGNAPKTLEEFYERYRLLTDALLDNKGISAFCYTQLYDIESEANGLYTYDRQPKFDTELIKTITSRKAKIEEF